MKLYDIVTADGEFVESLTQREIMNKFGLTKCRFRTFLDNSYLIDGKYWIDDSAEDMQVTRNGCRKMLKQFDALTENIRRLVGWEAHETGSMDREYLGEFDLEHYEVVGNIFDNKELLQEETNE